jgi:hypothetical protein
MMVLPKYIEETVMIRVLILVLFVMVPLSAAQAQRVSEPPRQMQGFPHKDGPFSAMLMLLDDSQMSEFAKPSSQGLQLKAMGKAKRGDKVHLVIGFMGMALDYDLNANVEFDFKIIAPDGKPAGDPGLNIPALKEKITNPAMVFHNRSDVIIVFEDGDKAGIYKIEATIRDKVGGKSVALEETIELVD